MEASVSKNVFKFSYRWKISNFKHLYCDFETNVYECKPLLPVLYSNVFPDQNDFQFVLRLIPKFVEDETVYLSVFLYLETCKSDELLKTKFTISIIDKDGRKFNVKKDSRDFVRENCFGFEKFDQINQEFLQTNQNLTLFCEVKIENNENKFAVMSKDGSTYTSEVNSKLWIQNIDCKWSIDNFINYLLNRSNSGDDKTISIKSPKFVPPANDQIGFFLVLILDNSKEDSIRDYISIYLYFQSEMIDKLTVSYQLSILDWEGLPYVTGEGRGDIIVGENGAKGCPKFIKRAEILDLTNGLLSRNVLTITAKIIWIQPMVKNIVKTLNTDCSVKTFDKQVDKSQESQGKIERRTKQVRIELPSRRPQQEQPQKNQKPLGMIENSENKIIPEYNILLLGEIGSGKSTTINAFANYLKYGDFKTAKASEFVQMIPSEFTLPDQDSGEPILIHSGMEDENEKSETGSSSTKALRRYAFRFKNRILRFIDTPGMGYGYDANGVNVDQENFDQIFAHLHEYKQLHAILVLINATEKRKTASFRYCITELLRNLHQSVCQNLIFCYTFSSDSFYGPGEGFTNLKLFLSSEFKNVPLKLEPGHNCFFFDNEAYRFLVAKKKNYPFRIDQEASYKKSWNKSSDEMNKLFDIIILTEPHNLESTISLNKERKIIFEIVKPLILMKIIIESNIIKIESKKNLLKNSSENVENLMKKLYLYQDDLESEPLNFPRTVCTSDSCTEVIIIDGDTRINYKTVCHHRCTCTLGLGLDTAGHPSLKKCSAMEGHTNCATCGCDWQKHMLIKTKYFKVKRQIVYEYNQLAAKTKEDAAKVIEKIITQMEALIEDYDCDLTMIMITLFQSSELLFPGSNGYNKFVGPYLEPLMGEELKKAKTVPGYSLETYELLKRMNTLTKNEKTLKYAITNLRVHLEDFIKYKDGLLGLKQTGNQFRQILEMILFENRFNNIQEKTMEIARNYDKKREHCGFWSQFRFW